MKRLFVVLVAFINTVSSQTTSRETGSPEVIPVLHATFVLKSPDHTIYFDPHGEGKNLEKHGKADIIFITDIHGDHLNTKTLSKLNTEGVHFVVPEAVAERLPEQYKTNLTILQNGEQTLLKGITVKAVPMYNLPEDTTSRHPKGRGNGYVLTINGKRIYVSGDTEDIPEMRALKNIDIALVCMNLPYTMNIHQAADAVAEFGPKVVYPYHYRGKPGMSDIALFKQLVNDKNPGVEVRLLNWYPE
ncbi:MBL fold metallo-hydrolase [Ascidiimonas aurantiaca]|uniref:MBL fold metallo-hydrolase n=1 Tax=Ascidiimonas aurantiaca TaxID=1685432 RepID=UPI0030EBF632